jgi:hypothetical protein
MSYQSINKLVIKADCRCFANNRLLFFSITTKAVHATGLIFIPTNPNEV